MKNTKNQITNDNNIYKMTKIKKRKNHSTHFKNQTKENDKNKLKKAKTILKNTIMKNMHIIMHIIRCRLLGILSS